jgi:hypothetical protein
MKPETKFRIGKVNPLLLQCANFAVFPIQQLGIHDDPDFFISARGKLIALELKSEEGSLRRLQAYKLWQVRQTGNLAFVARPSNWKDIKRILITINKGEKLNGNDETYSDNEILRYLKL